MGEAGQGTKQGANGKVSVRDLPSRIDEYFETCKPKYVEEKGGSTLMDGDKAVFTMNSPTINGLCRFLGYTSVSYVNNVMKHENSKRAKLMQAAVLRIAEWHESRLGDKNSAGSQFWLRHAQKELFGDQPQTHLVAGVGDGGLKLTEEEVQNFKSNLSVLLSNKQEDDQVEDDEELT